MRLGELPRKMSQDQNIIDENNGSIDFITNISQGNFRVSNNPAEFFTSILGSCIAVCIHDPVTGIGGMNHFLLPRPDGDMLNLDYKTILYGSFLIERMVNAAIAMGAFRSSLQAKVFGGSNMYDRGSNIGSKNADFVEHYLQTENLVIVATDLRGDQARKLRFKPATGKAWLKRLSQPDRMLLKSERDINLDKIVNKNSGKVDIFNRSVG